MTKKIIKREYKPSKTGFIIKEHYCRKCMRMRDVREFYSAVDVYLDASGMFSICKDCVNKIYDDIFSTEKNMQTTILRMCKMLNIKYSEEAISATKNHIQTLREKGVEDSPVFGIYKIKLTAQERSYIGDNHPNLTYEEVTSIIVNSNDTETETETVHYDVKEFWGKGFDDDTYTWLEKELDEWKAAHRCDTKAEKVLLREIVLKQYEIEKARKEEKSTAALVKELQDLMKTSSLDPAKASAIGSGKSQDTFGAIVKLIEEKEPAEYYADKELFKDYDNLAVYFNNYVVRPLKNFITGSRDFTLNDEAGETTDESELPDIEHLNDGEINDNTELQE